MSHKYFFCFLILSLFLANPGLLIAQSENEIAAIVNGKQITQKEIDDSIIGQLLPLQQQINTIRSIALENLIIKALLENEAKRQGILIEELRRNLTVGKVEVSLGEVEKEYLENASAFAQMNPNEAKEIIRLNFETQARIRIYREAIKKLKQLAKIEIRSPKDSTSVIQADTDGPSIGTKEALVNIIEFSDFQCSYCRESTGTLKHLLQEYRGKIRLVYKHLPLQPRSFIAARASYCAEKQERFWDYHDLLFTANDLSNESLTKTAEKIGLNLLDFQTCMGSEISRQSVLKDLQEAKRLGIDATPTFIINGKIFRGAINLEEFRQIIEAAINEEQKFVGK